MDISINIPSLEDVSLDYSKALAKHREIKNKIAEYDSRIVELNSRIAERVNPGAAELLASDNLEAALQSAPDLHQELQTAHNHKRTLLEALSQHHNTLTALETKAKRQIGPKIDNKWREILQRQAAAVLELSLAVEDYRSVQAALPGGHAQSCGLDQMPLMAHLGVPSKHGHLNRGLRNAVKLGLLDRKEIPAEWQV